MSWTGSIRHQHANHEKAEVKYETHVIDHDRDGSDSLVGQQLTLIAAGGEQSINQIVVTGDLTRTALFAMACLIRCACCGWR